ncbi:MAG: HigA family addiction module antidote protein [Caldilineaceae bacterium]|nr:HigA family addiction module antidote protein [Caldilineaceae bacterium]
MSIRIEDLSTTDFTDVATDGQLQPVKPGDILLHDFMEPLGLSANALATALHVPPNRITGILSASRRVTADTALRLARYFGTTPQFWMNLQSNYDLKLAETKVGNFINRRVLQRLTASYR